MNTILPRWRMCSENRMDWKPSMHLKAWFLSRFPDLSVQELARLLNLTTECLGGEFDVVINIDGFNELALANLNEERGLDAAMPSGQHIVPLSELAAATLGDVHGLYRDMPVPTLVPRLLASCPAPDDSPPAAPGLPQLRCPPRPASLRCRAADS